MKISGRLKSFAKYVSAKIRYKNRVCLPIKGLSGLSIHLNDKESSAEIGKGISTRRDVLLNVSSDGKLVIDDNVFINDGTKINCRKHVYIGKNTIIGQNVLIYDHDHAYMSEKMSSEFKCDDVIIGENVWIGSGVIILKGTTIGANTVIGAGTVLKKSVPSNCVVYSKINYEIVEKRK